MDVDGAERVEMEATDQRSGAHQPASSLDRSLIDFDSEGVIHAEDEREQRTSVETIAQVMLAKESSSEETLMKKQNAVLEESKNMLSVRDPQIISSIINVKEKLLDVKQENYVLSLEMGNFHKTADHLFGVLKHNTQESIGSLISASCRDGQEKKDLLSEMTSMNEELNRRGETISSLKEVVSMYEKKVAELNGQQDSHLSAVERLKGELSDRNRRLQELASRSEADSKQMSQLREELGNVSQRLQDLDSQQNESNATIKRLRDELAEERGRAAEVARHADTQGTVEADRLSTSTVSKADDVSRLRDLEDSFEDRYCKLKVVAVKLKKRATEAQQLLDAERQRWAAERAQLTASAKTSQTLQQELDHVGDDLETARKEANTLRKAAAEAKAAEAGLRARLDEAQTTIDALKGSLDSAVDERETATKNLASKEAELETTLKGKVAEELIRKEKTKEATDLEERLKEYQNKLKAIEKEMESAKLVNRKQSVLSLEIENYEKSLSDALGRVASLEAEVKTLEDTRASLHEQIRLLEDQTSTEEARALQLHEDLVKARSGWEEAEELARSLETRVGQLSARLESERASAEAASLELASLAATVQTNTDQMLRQRQDLSNEVATLRTQLSATEEELDAVRADFDKYKVRAQSVLRKHQESGATKAETDARQRADEMRQRAESLGAKLDQASEQLERLHGEVSSAGREREAAEARCVSLDAALAERTAQAERTVSEHRSQRLSLEMLVQCYKSQLEEKEAAGADQVRALNAEIESLRNQLLERPPHDQPSDPLPEQAIRAEPPLLPREDGEGSEYVPDMSSPSQSPPPRHSPHALLPLDKLLEASDLHEEANNDVEFGSGVPGDAESELAALHADAERGRRREQHQAALLAEAEQDAARKEQLIAVLKAEIGRLERCVQRQPHAKNTEYLKNVVFKFVTLETGEDRLRLVPVITTLLQLSPDETNRLTGIAKGESPDGGGWGTYFSSWR